ncbi:MAG: hypothetical protein COW18_03920 [Zetaproteobacteria bacterium CG12_big_fil_rev_8_21_14_0_65_54_13]|nr:MAG: hypothetical protein COW18_03920 [Zetaproteobacteria bacterium CG12_big_fil_rev_8_21_14_0_65_54_13]PIX54756.1 MAG: hypothetical protein COZ50_06120 [Zetaproteobacteria bacterium CG_4_10_14_3_um_filter_54_28]PJA29688.1 MAG: hypothetical protein CO188_06200 [Zetaproteobacteria bacterium CG_4_9_14_3_um_filter_54_145]
MKTDGVHPNDSAILAHHGLNLQAVFDLCALPADLLAAIDTEQPVAGYRQLLLFAHGGRDLWQAIADSGDLTGEHPIDRFSVDTVSRYFDEENPASRYRLLYPLQPGTLPLQQLGKLAGWHHASPFRIGVNARWGSWFAYRAAVLADTAFTPTLVMDGASPCDSCMEKPCIAACPVVSSAGEIPLQACMDERLKPGSRCAMSCLARTACPVMAVARYEPEQIAYHYGRSLETIGNYRRR